MSKFEIGFQPQQYHYIHQLDVEGTADDAVMAYRELVQAWEGGKGLNTKEFAKVVHEYCTTGTIVNGGNYDYSSSERLLLGEIKKIINKLK